MNGSHCVISNFCGLSPPVFNYNNSQATSDKIGDVAIRHDNPHPPHPTPHPRHTDAIHVPVFLFLARLVAGASEEENDYTKYLFEMLF